MPVQKKGDMYRATCAKCSYKGKERSGSKAKKLAQQDLDYHNQTRHSKEKYKGEAAEKRFNQRVMEKD